MNQLQEKELEILKAFIEACDALNLNWFLVCGSALGAVKYGGFIPWDDDIDVGMFREDYERFLAQAPSLLPKHLFLQNYMSDPAFPHIFSKLRDSRTTYIEKTVADLPIHHGVYMDIFPLDGYPSSKCDQRWFERKKLNYVRKLNCAFKAQRRLPGKIRCGIYRMLGYHRHTERIAAKYDKMIKRYPIQSTQMVCNHGNWQGKLEYAPRAQYGDGRWASFEGLRVRIPEKYDEYLSQKYGSWRADLPEHRKKGHHHGQIIDLERPYTHYMKR